MQRHELEHLIRAAGAITGSSRIVVIGSQAILGSYRSAPAELLVSMEADVWPDDAPERAELVDGSIGELSPFHQTFGYYAHGVGPETATLAPGWRDRLVIIDNENTRGVVGLCLHPADIAVAKLLAGREKDIAYVHTMTRHGLVATDQLVRVIDELPGTQAEQVRRLLEC